MGDDNAATDGKGAYFELSFRPNARLVSDVRRFTTGFLSKLLADDDVAVRVAVASHELLANAVRYSSDGETTLRVVVDRSAQGFRVAIRTENSADGPHVTALEKAVRAAAKAEDLNGFYQDCLTATAKRAKGSGLGLARVRAESEMSLACQASDGRVHVHAWLDVAEEASDD